MPPPVLTFTANPLAETTLELAAPARLGTIHCAQSCTFQVGGKGFNVAKMLQRLGVSATALSFAGGTSGEACRQWLTAHADYAWQLIPTVTSTRAGTVVRAPETPETTFLGPDCIVDAVAARAAAEVLRDRPSGSIIAVCGSVPTWSDSDFAALRQAFLQDLPADGLVVDSYGAALADLVQRPLALVKINRDELRALARQLDLPPELQSVATALPVQRWIVTDGPRAICYRTSETAGEFLPPATQEVSATGSGDVFLATILAGRWTDHNVLPQLIRRAADFAARNAAHPSIAEFELPA